jgi:tRNA(Ile)-lysidine synthase
VACLCRKLQLPLEIGQSADGGVPSPGDSNEATARGARYRFFDEAAKRWGARYVATAHTSDDQVETVLHNIIRGTGLAGLGGIPSQRPLNEAATVVRPLLEVSRQDVLTYLTDLGQEYREDATNSQLRFTRNRLRHELLPLLASQYNRSIRQSLLQLGRLAAEARQVIQCEVTRVLPSCLRVVSDRRWIEFDCDALNQHPPYLVREVIACAWRRQDWPLQMMGFAEWARLERMVWRAHAAENLPGSIVARKQGSVLRLSREGT